MHSSKTLFAVIGLSLSIAACGDVANVDIEGTGEDSAALTPADIIGAVWNASAQEHTAAEICKLALHRSKNETILAWAHNSMAAHQQAYDSLRSMGETKHLKISKIMTLEGDKQYAELFVRGSSTFDAAFKAMLIKLQARGGEYTQALYDATTDAQLRAWATDVAALWTDEEQSSKQLP